MGITFVDGTIPWGYILDSWGRWVETSLRIEFVEQVNGICLADAPPAMSQ